MVLCAYLGQLAHMRDAFSDKVAVIIDERDREQLAEREGENEESEDPMQPTGAIIDHVKVSRRVRLRTIDNFQGEEAKVSYHLKFGSFHCLISTFRLLFSVW